MGQNRALARLMQVSGCAWTWQLRENTSCISGHLIASVRWKLVIVRYAWSAPHGPPANPRLPAAQAGRAGRDRRARGGRRHRSTWSPSSPPPTSDQRRCRPGDVDPDRRARRPAGGGLRRRGHARPATQPAAAAVVHPGRAISQQQQGQPEWIADVMTDGGYIFIYLPTSQCLAATGPRARPRLTAARCDLSLRQRWSAPGCRRARGRSRLLPVRQPRRRQMHHAGQRIGRAGTARRASPLRLGQADPAADRVLVDGSVTPVSRKAPAAAPPWTSASSASGISNWPLTRSESPPALPITKAGTPALAHSVANSASAPGRTSTTALAADSLNKASNGSPGSVTLDAEAASQARLGQRDRQPAVGQVVGGRQQPAAARRHQHLGERCFGAEVDRRRAAAQVPVRDPGPQRAAELRPGRAEQHDAGAGHGEAGADPAADVLVHAEHPDDRGRLDRHAAGLVVEADVPAGDRRAQGQAAVGQPAHGLGELPHHAGVLGRAEVEAVGHRQRPGAGHRHVPVCLAERELCPGVGVELAVAAVSVGRQRDRRGRLCSSIRSTPASCGVASTVSPRT